MEFVRPAAAEAFELTVMLATIASAALQGIDAEIVHVEVNAGEAGEPKLMSLDSISPKPPNDLR